MSRDSVRPLLLLANAPVALFTVMATFTGLFGLAAPEPNPFRWLAIASPILLAGWLALANSVFQSGAASIGLGMMFAPIALLLLLISLALTVGP